MSKLKEKSVVAGGADLPGMPDGDVPKDIRVTAETVVMMRQSLKNMRTDLKETEERLMLDMGRKGLRVAVVILNDRKYRLFCHGSAPKIALKEEGLSAPSFNGQASTKGD